MIRITKSTTNKVFLTLTELSTLVTPVYLFRFIQDQTKEEFLFIAEDISTNTERYNEFDIAETSNPDTLDSEVSLVTAGYYSYFIYERADPVLEIPNSEPLEVGKVLVVGASENDYIYNNDSDDVVYNP